MYNVHCTSYVNCEYLGPSVGGVIATILTLNAAFHGAEAVPYDSAAAARRTIQSYQDMVHNALEAEGYTFNSIENITLSAVSWFVRDSFFMFMRGCFSLGICPPRLSLYLLAIMIFLHVLNSVSAVFTSTSIV